MTRRETWILRGFAVWVTYEWVTLLWNVWHDHAAGQGLGFKLVHTVLAVITIAFAAVAWRAVSTIRSRHLLSPEPRSARREATVRRRAAFRGLRDSSVIPGPPDVIPDPADAVPDQQPQGAGNPG